MAWLQSVTIPKAMEDIVLKEIELNHFVQNNVPTSEMVRKDQMMIINKGLNEKTWKDLKSRYHESDIKKLFFNSTTEYLIFVNSIESKKLAKQTVKNHTNPHFISEQDVDNYFNEKESTITDHNPVIENNKIKVGTVQAQFMLDGILVNQGYKDELLPEGLQAIAIQNGIFITIRNCLSVIDRVNKQIKLSKYATADKSGFVTMKEEARKTVTRYCKNNNISPEMSSIMAIQAEKMVEHASPSLGRMIGNAMTATEEKERQKRFSSIVEKLGELMGIQCEPLNFIFGEKQSTD